MVKKSMLPAAVSYGEYLRLENAAEERHLLWDGQMICVSGGSENHLVLETNLVGLLGQALSGTSFRVSTCSRRFRSLEPMECAVYADASIIDGPTKVHPDDPYAATNPAVFFEVLSNSTEAFDRGMKSSYYRTFSSLRSIVLVSQHEVRIEHFHRPEGSEAWTITELGEGEALELSDIGVTLSVVAIYERTAIPRAV